MKFYSHFLLLSICCYMFGGVHYAFSEAPPIPGKTEVRPSRISKIKHLDYAKLRALAQGKALTLPIPYKILVIRVEFDPDTTSRTTGNGTFEPGTTKLVVEAFMGKLKDFYDENSYSQLIISYTVTAKYSLSKKMSSYGFDSPYDQYELLVSDILDPAMTTLLADYTLTEFDHFMIYHAGAGQESDSFGNTPDDIWSAFVTDLSISGPIKSATFVPELENGGADPLGVICHEYGHQLGLPDLYYVNSGVQVSTLGYWSLMDAGVWIGSPQGSNPSHLDAWSKLDLGFITPVEVTGDVSNLPFLPAETSAATFYKITIPVADDPVNEFFLLEYRFRASGAAYDQFIPGDGILVYHVDNSIAQDVTRRADNDINSGVPHLGIDIEEADGTDSGGNLGDAADAFGTGLNTFGDPLSRAYNGMETGITLTMSASAGSGSLDVISISFESAMTVRKLINYPNPSTDGETTFHVRLSRPYKDIELLIYTIAGEKVRDIGQVSFRLNSSKSSDNNWVYEYTWDGKNGSGDNVASGVYFYLLRIDNDKKETGKLAIVK